MHEDEKFDGLDDLMEELPPVRDKKPRSKDPKLDFLLLQVTACVVLLLAALVIKLTGGGLYAEAREKYIELFEDETTISEVVESMAGVFQMTPQTTSISSEAGQGEKHLESSSAPAVSDVGSAAPAVSGDSATPPVSDGVPGSASSGASVSAGETDASATSDISSAASSSQPPVADGSSAAAALKKGEEEDDVTSYLFDFGQAQTALPTAGARVNTMLAPVSGTVTSPYGYRTHPITGKYTMHGGLDIGAEEGTGIQAAMDGVVKTVAQSESYGLYIVVDHQNGLETWYAHCSKLLAAEGTKVRQGDIIAEVGQTGYATGPHCHFEVRVQGTKLNPAWLLRLPEAA